MLYLSEYFEIHREEYYQRLLNISENNDWESWITYFLNAVYEQSIENTKKGKAIKTLYDNLKKKIGSLIKSRFTIETLDLIFSNPLLYYYSIYKEFKNTKSKCN